MSRARERLVLLEDLVDGAPTLPIDVLLYNELTDKTLQEMVEECQEPMDVEAEAKAPGADG
jgi:DNA helicase-2/ATP-dependent DNA helicase PcrA